MPNQRERGIVAPRDSLSRDMVGTVGATGVVVRDRYAGDVLSFLPAPTGKVDRKAVRVSSITGEMPLPKRETSYLRTFGSEQAAAVATRLIEVARDSVELPFSASFRGVEVESFSMGTTGNNLGRFVSSENREELTYGAKEGALPPAPTIEAAMLSLAEYLVQFQDSQSLQGRLPVNTSAQIIGSADDEGAALNTERFGHFTKETRDPRTELIGTFSDPAVEQLGNWVARKYGYPNLWELAHEEPSVRFWWSNAAGQTSISLPHIANESGKDVIPSEIAIAASDMLNSDMAKVPSLLLFSSPLFMGEMPTLQIAGEKKQLRDVRDVLKRTMATAWPGPMIENPETLNKRFTHAIVYGKTTALDKAAYPSDNYHDAMANGAVRLRITRPSDEKTRTGRVEVTEAGNTFSLLDKFAFNVIIDVMKLGAFEAVAHGQHPIEYFGEKYPMLRGNSQRTQIGDEYNFDGPNSELATEAINQTLQFLEEMGEKYPAYQANIAFAKWRIANLKNETTARNFDEYYQQPVGQVTEVMRHMVEDGKEPWEIAQAVSEYEYRVAQDLIRANGDAKNLYQ